MVSWEDVCVGDCLRDLLVACLLFCIVASSVGSSIDPVNQPHGNHSSEFEITFTAYRLRQFNYGGVAHGSRTARFSYDVVALKDNVVRRCLVVRWSELEDRELSEVVGGNAGATLVIFPKGLQPPTQRVSAHISDSQHVQVGKKKTLVEEFAELDADQAIYFAESTPELELLAESAKASKAPSAFQQILSLFVENSFQASTTLAANPTAIPNKFFNIIVSF